MNTLRSQSISARDEMRAEIAYQRECHGDAVCFDLEAA